MTIDDQIKCIKQELSFRRTMYPRWIHSEKMKQSKAEHELAALAAVLETLIRVGAAESEQRGLF